MAQILPGVGNNTGHSGISNLLNTRVGEKNRITNKKDPVEELNFNLREVNKYLNKIIATQPKQIWTQASKSSLGDDATKILGNVASSNEGIGKAINVLSSKTEGSSNILGSKLGTIAQGISSGNQSTGDLLKGISSNGSASVPIIKIIATVLNTIGDVLHGIADKFDASVEQALQDRERYLGPINTRLQGLQGVSENYYDSMLLKMNSVFTMSAFVSQQEYLANLNKLISAGIAENVESRAFIETMVSRTVTTFDALDKSIVRMTRIQQNDVTLSQLGVEGALTTFLNRTFRDTTYLSDLYDSVSSAIMTAGSQLDASAYAEFSYAVQAWLGSMYTQGVSSQAIESIASALNLLGSGDVSKLASNQTAQTMLALAASGAGQSYADLLINGLEASDINTLMVSMVNYLQDISTNTSANEVVRSAWGDILNLSVADIRAIANLSAANIEAIQSSVGEMSYANTIKAAQDEFSQLGARTSLTQKFKTTIDNILYSVGSQISSSVGLLGTWMLSGLVESVGELGSNVPIFGELINAIGNISSGGIKLSTIETAMSKLTPFQQSFGEKMFNPMTIAGAILTGGTSLLPEVFNFLTDEWNVGGTTTFASGESWQDVITVVERSIQSAATAGVTNITGFFSRLIGAFSDENTDWLSMGSDLGETFKILGYNKFGEPESQLEIITSQELEVAEQTAENTRQIAEITEKNNELMQQFIDNQITQNQLMEQMTNNFYGGSDNVYDDLLYGVRGITGATP